MSSAIIKEYESMVMNSIPIEGDHPRMSGCVLGLEHEADNMCDMVDKIVEGIEKVDLPAAREQLSHILWYLTALSGVLGFTLEDLASVGLAESVEAGDPS